MPEVSVEGTIASLEASRLRLELMHPWLFDVGMGDLREVGNRRRKSRQAISQSFARAHYFPLGPEIGATYLPKTKGEAVRAKLPAGNLNI